ncbi:hypothetical protein AXF42_Ash013552 [Apostasia shenzhenica]|uniref:Inhibitor I9 domain-containing protein n=1 Tax=Apostasia shenzhenica TaxID=1088818 RepID=A0A2I0APB5_9ASPA|nr:hypothetical protein AXF42_Ash013552 [Apostasia shenzhenica]
MAIAMGISKALFLSFFVIFLTSLLPAAAAMNGEKYTSSAAAVARGGRGSKTSVYLVVLKPAKGVDTESLHVETLSAVLGSEAAAKGALIYSYKHSALGFSARLTPKQAAELAKQPGVLSVRHGKSYSLQSGIRGMGSFF